MTNAPSPDWAELRRLAEAATPGEWSYEPDDEWSSMGWLMSDQLILALILARIEGDSAQQADNAAYIAAANPNTILALLDERAALLARAEKAEAALADMTTAAAETDSANCGLSDALEKERAENARLREALKPFGMGEYFIPSADDIASEKFLRGCGIPWSDQPTTADHRRARALAGGDHG